MFYNWRAILCSSWSDEVVRGMVPVEFDNGLNDIGGWFNRPAGLENENCGLS